MEIEERDVSKLTNAIERLSANVDRLEKRYGNSSNSHASINGNGLIASLACIVLLLVGFAEMTRRYDRMQDYYNTTFMLVPKLRELVDLELSKQNKPQKQEK